MAQWCGSRMFHALSCLGLDEPERRHMTASGGPKDLWEALGRAGSSKTLVHTLIVKGHICSCGAHAMPA